MSILGFLERIEKTETRKEKLEIARNFYLASPTFQKYMKLAYAGKPRFKKLPKYTVDGAPTGMAPSNLDRIYATFEAGVYNMNVSDVRAETLFIQVLESVDPIEIEFLKQVIKGEVKVFTRKVWEEYFDNASLVEV